MTSRVVLYGKRRWIKELFLVSFSCLADPRIVFRWIDFIVQSLYGVRRIFSIINVCYSNSRALAAAAWLPSIISFDFYGENLLAQIV